MTTERPTPARVDRTRGSALVAAVGVVAAASLAACVSAAPSGAPRSTAVTTPAASDTPHAGPATLGSSAPPSSLASASASVPAPPASAPPLPPLPPGQCPAAITRAPESGFKDDEGVPGAAELPIEDLDGDGVPEIVVSFPASYTERGILVLKKVPAPTCFQVLYQGVGEGAGGRKSKTKGFVDLSVLMLPITSNGRGMAIAIGKFTGKHYRLESIEKCAGIDGKKLSAKECRGILAGYDDDAKGGVP